MSTTEVDVAVIGGGIVGLATAYQLLQQRPDLRVLVLEKEPDVGRHQSSHNSGVIHAGVYYAPGSLKARFCAAGKQALERYSDVRGIRFVRNGKVVVQVDRSEDERFEALRERARNNGVEGLREIGPRELAEIEPHAAGLRALHSPSTGSIDFRDVCRALVEDIEGAGGQVRTGAAVRDLDDAEHEVRLVAANGDVRARVAVACAGLQADRVASLTDEEPDPRIVPFRGSWLVLKPEARHLVNGHIYPVPDPRFPFLGVHLSRRINGSVLVGPNAVLALSRERYSRRGWDPTDVRAILRYPGFWRLAARHVATGAREVFQDTFRSAYVREVQRYVPEVTEDDLEDGPVGIRAQSVAPDGSLIDDFVITGTRRVMHVRNAPSPGATASLAIGEHLAREALARI